MARKNAKARAESRVQDVQRRRPREAAAVSSTRPARGRLSLQELAALIPDNYENTEVDWGRPTGKEVW